jgi:hypothetical protein
MEIRGFPVSIPQTSTQLGHCLDAFRPNSPNLSIGQRPIGSLDADAVSEPASCDQILGSVDIEQLDCSQE